jgi:CheY-like chemotaxis protein
MSVSVVCLGPTATNRGLLEHWVALAKFVILAQRVRIARLAFLSYVTCNSVALAVVDIWMSSMSGLQVQKKLQAVLPKTRVVIVTATDGDSVRNAAIEGGAIAYFVKPFEENAFSPPCKWASPRRAERAESDVPRGGHYRPAAMPYFMEFSTAVGMHAGYLPGYPASHGCVRMPRDLAALFFERVQIGTPVTVVGSTRNIGRVRRALPILPTGSYVVGQR